MIKRNILITSISSKVPLIKAVKNAKDNFSKDIKIYGADISDNVIGKYFNDIAYMFGKELGFKTNASVFYDKIINILMIIDLMKNKLLKL